MRSRFQIAPAAGKITGVVVKAGTAIEQPLPNARLELSGGPGAAWVTRSDLNAAIMAGTVERVRPIAMTVVAIMAGLIPIMWSTGTGSEVMRRIAMPMVGGMASSTLLTLVVIPVIYSLVKGWQLRAHATRAVEAHP